LEALESNGNGNRRIYFKLDHYRGHSRGIRIRDSLLNVKKEAYVEFKLLDHHHLSKTSPTDKSVDGEVSRLVTEITADQWLFVELPDDGDTTLTATVFPVVGKFDRYVFEDDVAVHFVIHKSFDGSYYFQATQYLIRDGEYKFDQSIWSHTIFPRKSVDSEEEIRNQTYVVDLHLNERRFTFTVRVDYWQE
jgi:hypothetical protein